MVIGLKETNLNKLIIPVAVQFRLIDTGYNTPSMNMSIDEALLSSRLPVLRFYRWKPAGLSIGYFQKISEINTEFCKKNNIEIVRRLTGGNAVLHDKELTYSFIINEKEMPKSVTESYKKISRGILKALQILGLDAAMNEYVSKVAKSAVCFSEPSWYEILVNNKKIVGSAQKRINRKLLQHGAVLIDVDIERYCKCFKSFTPGMFSKLQSRMTSINDELDSKVDYYKVALAMKKGFENELNIEFIEDDLTEEEKVRAEELSKKYASPEWTNLK